MRQSAAHSRHWLLTASGARGVRDWCLASGRWRSGRRQTDPASGPRPPTQMRPFSLCYRCLQRRQSGVGLVQPQLESALVIAEWPASNPEPLRCARQRHLPCSSCQSTAWQAQPASTATASTASKPEPLRCARQRHLPCSAAALTWHRAAGSTQAQHTHPFGVTAD